MGTPSRQYNWSAIGQNSQSFYCSLWRDFENLCMYIASVQHCLSVVTAAMILSQVMAHSLRSIRAYSNQSVGLYQWLLLRML